MDDRRRFERVDIPDNARIFVLDSNGSKLGPLRILGRGGMLFLSNRDLTPGSKMTLRISDEVEVLTRDVEATIRYRSPEGIGCEFEKLDADTAVEIGVWIGKFYSSRT